MSVNDNLKSAKILLERALTLKREKKAIKEREDLASMMAERLAEVLKNTDRAYLSVDNDEVTITPDKRDGTFVDLLKGENGEKGDKGEKGDRGERGERGADGRDGNDGRDGFNGKDGKNGLNGRDGKDGKNGLNGRDGKDGIDGSADTAEEIINKINSLPIQESVMIDASHIKNLPRVIMGFGGRKITSSGLTPKAPLSGAINGSNTIFEFATAPLGISVDQGRIMQRVSSDGTVNWTVAGSTVTLTVAPNFDIFAL